jgi:LysM repeat protein
MQMQKNFNQSYFMYKTRSRADVEKILMNMCVNKNEFAALNGKDTDAVFEGETVKIPYRLSGCVRGRFYMLNRNDTLLKIAGRRKLKVSKLLEANPYLNPGKIVLGQMIVLPEAEGHLELNCIEYVVERNDTLFDILRKFDLSIRELQEENPDCDLFSLKPGQVLLIRRRTLDRKRYYILKENETLHSVAKTINRTVISILKANPNLRPLEIKQGVKIVLPD